MDRRQFLVGVARTAPALALGAAVQCSLCGDSPSRSPESRYALPGHLPQKLSIGMFQHGWITMATEGEPYDDLEQAVAGLPERGFNSVRVEAGLNWCFHADGTPRGEMEFGALFPVYHDHLIGSPKGGGRHDVLKRVIRLLQLARKHGVYVVLTSWEYQDTNSLVADPTIRAEVMAVPEPQRFMALARHHDRLLRILGDKGLHENIAYIEVHNEPDASKFPQGAEGKKLHQEAIAFLRDRHGDVLVSGDYCSHDPSVVPDNVQVYDQHTYVGLYTTALYPQTVWRKDFDPANPRKNELLRRLLKDRIVPYDEFVKAAPLARKYWLPVAWLYHNLDIPRFDQWILEQYKRDAAQLKASAVGDFGRDAKEAARRKIPAVCDEGGYFLPPLGSQFELTRPGTDVFDLEVDLAIKHGYWGMMPTTYCGPEDPIWQDAKWLLTVNGRFQAGRILSA